MSEIKFEFVPTEGLFGTGKDDVLQLSMNQRAQLVAYLNGKIDVAFVSEKAEGAVLYALLNYLECFLAHNGISLARVLTDPQAEIKDKAFELLANVTDKMPFLVKLIAAKGIDTAIVLLSQLIVNQFKIGGEKIPFFSPAKTSK